MRVLRGVEIQRTNDDRLHAISQAAGIVGEEMTLDLMGAGATLGLKVRVTDSRPVMVDGVVRHQIGLAMLNKGSDAAVATEQPREAKTEVPVQTKAPLAARISVGGGLSMEAV